MVDVRGPCPKASLTTVLVSVFVVKLTRCWCVVASMWRIELKTSDITFAGSEAKVFFTLFGKTKRDRIEKTPEHVLSYMDGSPITLFERDSTTVVYLTLPYVGTPYKVQLRVQAIDQKASDWHLASLKLTNKITRVRRLISKALKLRPSHAIHHVTLHVFRSSIATRVTNGFP